MTSNQFGENKNRSQCVCTRVCVCVCVCVGMCVWGYVCSGQRIGDSNRTCSYHPYSQQGAHKHPNNICEDGIEDSAAHVSPGSLGIEIWSLREKSTTVDVFVTPKDSNAPKSVQLQR